jgi:hypothetical protein
MFGENLDGPRIIGTYVLACWLSIWMVPNERYAVRGLSS